MPMKPCIRGANTLEAIEIISESDSGALLSAKEFLDLIRRSNDRWWDDNGKTTWVFRGVGDSEKYKLIPSAWREPEFNKLKPLLEKIGFEKHNEDIK